MSGRQATHGPSPLRKKNQDAKRERGGATVHNKLPIDTRRGRTDIRRCAVLDPEAQGF